VGSATFTSTVDDRLAGRPLPPPARAAVAKATQRPLSGAPDDGVPPGARVQVATAIEDASMHAFRFGMLVSGALVLCGGLVGFAAVRNPRRRVPAGQCPGGAIFGAPEETAQITVAACPRASRRRRCADLRRTPGSRRYTYGSACRRGPTGS
jgi:hypothetical protein